MYQSTKVLAAAVVFGAVVSGAGIKSQAADSPCKGLAQEPCQAQGCSWVKSYKTKGKDVAAFCRKKPERKATSAAAMPKS